MTPEDAIQRVSEIKSSVRIQKLSRATIILDCHKSLWAYLGVTREQVWNNHHPLLTVNDFPFQIWMCLIGIGDHSRETIRAYGKTFTEAVENAIGAEFI